jgi:hypothetical protein
MFSQPLSFNDAREERKESSENTLHTHQYKNKNSPNSATSKVIDVLHLRAKVAAAIS